MERIYVNDSTPALIGEHLQSLQMEVNGSRYISWDPQQYYPADVYENLMHNRSYFEHRREFLISQINTLCTQGIDFLQATTDYLNYMSSIFSTTANTTHTTVLENIGNDVLYSTREVRIKKTPMTNVVWQSGQRGQGLCISNNAEVNKILSEEYNLTGIYYKDGIPDFTPLELARVVVDCIETVRSRNFAKADKKMQEELGLPRKEIILMRTQNNDKFTWHECNDRKTMQLVERKIHETFLHLGGRSEAKKRERLKTNENNR